MTELADAAVALDAFADRHFPDEPGIDPCGAPLLRAFAEVLRQVDREHPRVDVNEGAIPESLSTWIVCGKCRTARDDWPGTGLVAVYASDNYPCATVRAVLAAVAPALDMLQPG